MIRIAVILLLCLSCQRYPDFKKTGDVYFKLIEIGEDSLKAKTGDYVTADVNYKTITDSVFLSGVQKFQLSQNPGLLEQCIMMLSKGDKAAFIIPAKSFFNDSIPGFLQSDDDIKIEIKLMEVQSEQDYQQEKEAFLKWAEEFSAYEKTVLQHYMEGKKMNVSPTATGLYYIREKAGNGKKAEPGKIVEIRYTGRFLNGKFINSENQTQTLSFVYGTELQVIPGLDEAIGLMTEEEKALVIIPSNLAWGVDGSSSGMIPPYTSTIFEVELLSVKEK